MPEIAQRRGAANAAAQENFPCSNLAAAMATRKHHSVCWYCGRRPHQSRNSCS